MASTELQDDSQGLVTIDRTHVVAVLTCAALLGLATLLGLSDGIGRLVSRWIVSPAYTHGFLVLALSLYIVFVRVREPTFPFGPGSVFGLLGLAALVLVYSILRYIEFTTGMYVVLPLVPLAIVLLLGGWSAARELFTPIAYLYLAVPVWDFVRTPLANLAAAVVSSVLTAADLNAYIIGNLIELPSGTVEITDDCSGISYLLVAAAIVSFFLMRTRPSIAVSAALLAFALLIGFLANWIRIVLLVLIGHYTEMTSPLMTDHEFFGWVAFCFLAVPALGWALRFLKHDPDEEPPGGARSNAKSSFTKQAVSYSFVGLVVLLMPLLSLQSSGFASLNEEPQFSHSGLSPEWLETTSQSGWAPEFAEPQQEIRTAFQRPEHPHVELYAARYLVQEKDSKLLASKNSVTGPARALQSSTRATGAAGLETVTETTAATSQGNILIWHWYSVSGRGTHSERTAKLLQIPGLLRARTDGTVVAIGAACNRSCEMAADELQSFMDQNQPLLLRLPESGLP